MHLKERKKREIKCTRSIAFNRDKISKSPDDVETHTRKVHLLYIKSNSNNFQIYTKSVTKYCYLGIHIHILSYVSFQSNTKHMLLWQKQITR